MTPRAFSFNSPHGACPECQGLGAVYDFDPGAHRARRLAVAGRRRHRAVGEGRQRLHRRDARGAAARRSASIRTCRSAKLPKKLRDIVLLGAPGRPRPRERAHAAKTPQDPFGADFEGAIPEPAPPLRRRHLDRSGGARAVPRAAPCPACDGERLRPESRAVRVKGRRLAEYVEPADCRRAAACSRRSSSPSASSSSPAACCGRFASGCASWSTSASAI